MKKILYVITMCLSMLGVDFDLQTNDDINKVTIVEDVEDIEVTKEVEDYSVVQVDNKIEEVTSVNEIEVNEVFSISDSIEDSTKEILPKYIEGFPMTGYLCGLPYEIGYTSMHDMIWGLKGLGCIIDSDNFWIAPFHVHKVYTTMNMYNTEYTIELVTGNLTNEPKKIDDCYLLGLSLIGDDATSHLVFDYNSDYDFYDIVDNYSYIVAKRDNVAFALTYPHVTMVDDYSYSVGKHILSSKEDSTFGSRIVNINGKNYNTSDFIISDVIKTFRYEDDGFANEVDILPLLCSVNDATTFRASDAFSCFIESDNFTIEMKSYMRFNEDVGTNDVWQSNADSFSIFCYDEENISDVDVTYGDFKIGMTQTEFENKLKEVISDELRYELLPNSSGGMSYRVVDSGGFEVVTLHFKNEILSGITFE